MHAIAANADPAVLLAPLILIVVAIAIAAGIIGTLNRSTSMLERHLRAEGYRLVARQSRWLARGPFLWTTTKGQQVFRFVAEDPAGVRREGWARVGGFILGLLTERVDVRWDERPHERGGPGFPVVMPPTPTPPLSGESRRD